MARLEGNIVSEGESAMREVIVELAICLLLGLLCLGLVVWDIVRGGIAYLDGIAFAIIVLTIAAFFLFNVFWSYRTGELRQILQELRKRKSDSETIPD